MSAKPPVAPAPLTYRARRLAGIALLYSTGFTIMILVVVLAMIPGGNDSAIGLMTILLLALVASTYAASTLWFPAKYKTHRHGLWALTSALLLMTITTGRLALSDDTTVWLFGVCAVLLLPLYWIRKRFRQLRYT